MIYHYAYGVIPLKRFQGHYQALVIKRVEGFWEFPKGHLDGEEAALEAAQRECFEETGLTVQDLLAPVPFTIQYSFSQQGETIQKIVNYFLAVVDGDIVLQSTEVAESKWVPVEEIAEHVTHANSKELCGHVLEFLKEKNLT